MRETAQPAAHPWPAEVFRPFPEAPGIVFARAAARSALFTGPDRTVPDGTGTGPGPGRDGDDVVIGSAAGAHPQDSARRARSELVERMANIVAGRTAETARTVVATHGELRRAGRPAVDPALLVGASGVSDDLRDAPGLWAVGRWQSTGREVLVPAAAVYLRHRPPPGCRAALGAGSTGLAAHPDEASAEAHAQWEILERDLIRRSWYGDGSVSPTTVSWQPEPVMRSALALLGVEAVAFLLPAPAGAACVVVCVHRPDRTGQAFGARCGPAGQVPALAEKAAYEALMVRWSMGTEVARRTWAQWAGRTSPGTALQHALWTYHRQDSLGLWLTDPGPAAPRPPVTATTGPAALLSAHTGEDLVVVPTPTPLAEEAGLHVVRVVAPGARPLPARPPVTTGRGRADHPHPFG
ncbi:YcaO-like family protein [Streptomyces sp. BE20]|uniref:YcaO-like family protein n=1 Tax=Streptomyces sp. BE20 TaxID=3002525 RepID=UPI002E79D00B|nr:YcaO-like family protein [Streptomyces sp. BE20]MEE1821317.1 YcaO-like family protein [Streptomyces sp. BE20]